MKEMCYDQEIGSIDSIAFYTKIKETICFDSFKSFEWKMSFVN